MKTETMRAFLDATNGGLDIFRNYIKTPFTLDKMEIVKSINKRFIVSYNERYKNYVVKIEDWDGIKWTNSRNFNAVWYVKEIYELNEQQAYDKIEYDMELKITINSNDIEKNENEDLETLSDESNYREKIIQKTLKKKRSLLDELMNSKPKTIEYIDSHEEEQKSNETSNDINDVTIQRPKLPGLE